MAEKKTTDEWFAEERAYSDGLLKLRELALGAGMSEALKWGQPCYSHESRNIIGIGAFKAYFGLWFFEGARLADKDGVFINAQPGKTHSMRQWRFMSADDVKPTKIKKYIAEAKALEPVSKPKSKAPKAPPEIPDELTAAFKEDKSFKTAFDALTPARQREYVLHISEAKLPVTRSRRLTKITPLVIAGAGLHDKYR